MKKTPVLTRGIMFNDGDCGFCMKTAALAPKLGVNVDAVTLQTVDMAQYGVDGDRARVEMAYVDPDGVVTYGHEAWASILATGPLFWRAVGRTMVSPPIAPLARYVYHWVANNRERLPGGTPSCTL